MDSYKDSPQPSDGEPDSDPEDADVNQALGAWLDHLQQAQENVPDVKRRSRPVTLTSQVAKERFRASIMAAGENAEVDLDAILGELCELETQLTTTQDELTSLQTKEVPAAPPTGLTAPPTGHTSQPSSHTAAPGGSTDSWEASGIDSQLQDALSELSDFISGDLSNLGGSSTEPTPVKPKKPPISRPPPIDTSDSSHVSDIQYSDRTMESPEVPMAACRPMETSGRDSGISESVSIPSSSSHMSVNTNTSGVASSCGSGDTPNSPKEVLQAHLNDFQTQLETLTPEEQKVKLKQEKLRLALEKLEQTNLEKLLVRAFTPDGSCKSIFVGENMTVLDVTQVLAVKNHMKLNPDLAVVEILPDLCMERIFEDHESLVENLLYWTKDSPNKVEFRERPERYHFFTHPECYLPVEDGKLSQFVSDAQRSMMLEKFFDGITMVPKMEGVLLMKVEGKKTWKKYFFSLRASGLCYSPKSKGKPTSDVTCLQKLDMVDVYYGIDWKKKFKAPSDYGFALKHPQIQKKASKYIHYLCGETEAIVKQWVNAIRVCKYGRELLENYQLVRDISEHWDGSELVPGIAQAPKPVEKIQNGGHSVQKVDLNANEKSHTPNSTPTRVPPQVETVAIRTGHIHKEPKHGYEEQDTDFITTTQTTGAYIPVSTSTLKHIAGHSGTLNRSPEKKASTPERRFSERKASTPERKLPSLDGNGSNVERRAPPPVAEKRAPPHVAEKRVPPQVAKKKKVPTATLR